MGPDPWWIQENKKFIATVVCISYHLFLMQEKLKSITKLQILDSWKIMLTTK